MVRYEMGALCALILAALCVAVFATETVSIHEMKYGPAKGKVSDQAVLHVVLGVATGSDYLLISGLCCTHLELYDGRVSTAFVRRLLVLRDFHRGLGAAVDPVHRSQVPTGQARSHSTPR